MPARRAFALCSREVAVQEEIKKYGFDAALIPSGLLYLCGKSLADYPSIAGEREVARHGCDRRVTRPLRIYGVAGHMHTRGYDIQVKLNGKMLLHIPRWNFHWQDAYYLAAARRRERRRHDPRQLQVRQLEDSSSRS